MDCRSANSSLPHPFSFLIRFAGLGRIWRSLVAYPRRMSTPDGLDHRVILFCHLELHNQLRLRHQQAVSLVRLTRSCLGSSRLLKVAVVLPTA